MDASNQRLKSIMRGSIAVLVVLFAHTLVWSASHTAKQPAFSPDIVLVAFHSGTPAADISAVHRQVGGRVKRTLAGIDVQVVSVPVGTVLDKVKLYRRNPNVRYAEPNYYRPLIIPNEGSFSSTLNVFDEQWNLHNQGQPLQTYTDPTTGLPGWQYTREDADIDAPEAWNVETGSSEVWVAIPDSGVDCDHGDLQGKCLHQEDFVTPTLDSYDNPIPELIDRLGHGTHVAGTIAMQTDNNAGGAGVGWQTSIGSFKVCYAEVLFEDIIIGSSCQDADIVAAIDRIIELGYDIINMSFGGPASQVVEEALNRASEAGTVLIAAAGNNNNWEKFYPAAYDNVIAVGASNAFDDRAGFSTFSVDDDGDPSTQNDDWVDVLAPGDPILGPVPRNFCAPVSSQCFQWKSGTSMAAPHVSGVAALVLNYLRVNDPANATPAEVRRRIQDCADQTGAMGQNMLAWSKYGRLNAYGAVTCNGDGGGGSTPPSSISLTANGYKMKGVQKADLQWTGTSSEGKVQVYRDGNLIATLNSGTTAYTDNIDQRGGGTYTYKVCETATTCSNDSSVVF